MNVQELSVLLREVSQFAASIAHLVQQLHGDKREPTANDHEPLYSHMGRVAIAMTGTDPNSIPDDRERPPVGERNQIEEPGNPPHG